MLIVRLLSHLQLTGSLHIFLSENQTLIFTVIFTFTIQDEGHHYPCAFLRATGFSCTEIIFYSFKNLIIISLTSCLFVSL